MPVQKFTANDAKFARSPGLTANIFVANVVDHSDGAPITIGYGRYGAGQSLNETMAVDDVMIVLEGGLSVASNAETLEAPAGAIVPMPKGQCVTITAGSEGALTAYVTYPHWETAKG